MHIHNHSCQGTFTNVNKIWDHKGAPIGLSFLSGWFKPVCLSSQGAFMCSGPVKTKRQARRGRAVIFSWDVNAAWQGVLFYSPSNVAALDLSWQWSFFFTTFCHLFSQGDAALGSSIIPPVALSSLLPRWEFWPGEFREFSKSWHLSCFPDLKPDFWWDQAGISRRWEEEERRDQTQPVQEFLGVFSSHGARWVLCSCTKP